LASKPRRTEAKHKSAAPRGSGSTPSGRQSRRALERPRAPPQAQTHDDLRAKGPRGTERRLAERPGSARDSGMERLSLRIRGRVQGVFYRAETQATASRLGLAGWVRNREDGSVELV